jgi:hypothetical protein
MMFLLHGTFYSPRFLAPGPLTARAYADHNCVKEPLAVAIDELTSTTRHNSKLLGRNGNSPRKGNGPGYPVGVALYSSATGNKKTFWPLVSYANRANVSLHFTTIHT